MKLRTSAPKKNLKVSPEETRKVDREVSEMTLRQLREAAGITQSELAQLIEATQPQLSQFENQADHRLSTLRRYVKALGGKLKLQAVMKGKTVDIVI